MNDEQIQRIIAALGIVQDVYQELADKAMKEGDPNHSLDNQGRYLYAIIRRFRELFESVENGQIPTKES